MLEELKGFVSGNNVQIMLRAHKGDRVAINIIDKYPLLYLQKVSKNNMQEIYTLVQKFKELK